MTLHSQLAAALAGERGPRCPACGIPLPIITQEKFRVCGTRSGDFNGCGHILVYENGTVRNLTTAEKLLIQKMDAERGGLGRKHQESIVARLIG